MPHIHTKPGEHDHTASAYVVRTDNDEPKILLHMHKKLGRYLQFGGHIETNETPWQAITHELLEESGYGMDQLKILQPPDALRTLPGTVLHPMPIYHQTHHFDETHFHTDVGYAFVTQELPANKIDEGESAALKWFAREEVLQIPQDEIFENVRATALYVFDVCLPKWEKIDTATFK